VLFKSILLCTIIHNMFGENCCKIAKKQVFTNSNQNSFTVKTIISITILIFLLLKLKVMANLVCTFCGKIDSTSEYALKRHLAVCSKRFSAYGVNEPVNESDKHS